jgi:hypothetical protein
VRDITFGGARNYISGFEGSQTVPACPSGRGNTHDRNGLLYDVGRATLERNCGVTDRRAACEACSATWNLGTKSMFALGSRKTTENLDRVGRSHDLPDAD